MSDLQLMMDEADVLERQVDELFCDPAQLLRELEQGGRDLAGLKAEIRSLDGPARHRASLLVTSIAIAAAAAIGIVGYVLGGGIL